MNIVVKNNQRYKQYKNRLRRLCNLEKCNYNSTSTGFCKKHNIKANEKICETCLVVKNTDDFIENNNNCLKCREKNERTLPTYKSKTFIKNGIRYTTYPNAGTRKMCKIESCPNVSCGEYCRKHKKQDIKENEKQCHRCLTKKNIEQFKKDNIEYTHCENCREYKKNNSLNHHQKRREFMIQLKINMGGKCVDCGTNDLEILEFDHMTDKVTELIRIYNYEGILDESKKCVLRCCNCHFIKTKATVELDKIDENNNNKSVLYVRGYRQRNRDYVNNIKIESQGCTQCGWFDINNLQVLHFDHINEKEKEHNISRLVNTGRNCELIQKEIDKCQILCANCHRKKTNNQFNYKILDVIEMLK